MTRFLIVNDDGADSPMLAPMATKLSALGQVDVAVPEREQSWQGKAMTRFGRVRAAPLEGLGVRAYSVDGTPSDCVNLAVHHLFDGPPDWVVSGINIGINAGTGFIINSGTVGAAMEGALQGLPAVAFSTYLKPHFFREWLDTRDLAGPETRPIVETTTTRMTAMMERLVESGLPTGTMVLNINFPGAVDGTTPVHWVPAQITRYGAIFEPDGDGFVHAARVHLHAEQERQSDRAVVLAGGISVTPLTLTGLTPTGIDAVPL